ncbi:chromate efflux transporter [Gallaecimonas sp. GXIMD4217]|uniref:chromate efflux transporter n=1 Tax=Gallaecimonas sp. GXIMD4217 TaxID=3131927 RepID=UPI00311B0AB2
MTSLFIEFFKLGLIAFGGPAAHIGYFQQTFVHKLGWLSQKRFAELMALCQLLPGPTSSQVGMAIGRERAGWPGALLAFVAFTLPSAALMIGAGLGLGWLLDWSYSGGVIHGLKLLAVLVVGQAVWTMARSLLPDRATRTLALVILALLLLLANGGQLWLLLAAAVFGAIALRPLPDDVEEQPGVTGGLWRLPTAIGLLTLLSLLPWQGLGELVRTGSLVFGGGHVVLPLLEETELVRGGMSEQGFLAGYGLAQAMPGPLFSFAGFIGAGSTLGPGGIQGGLLALAAIYLPSFVLLWGVLPTWQRLRHLNWLQGAIRGANAAVIAILAAIFYDPLWTSSVTDPKSGALLVLGAALMLVWRLPVWAMVALAVTAGALFL